MRVQFVWPNFDADGKSIGISYLSSRSQAGHDTRVEHICEGLDNLRSGSGRRHVKDYNPDLIAFSTGANHYPEMRQLSQPSKRSGPTDSLRRHSHHAECPAVMTDNRGLISRTWRSDDSVVDSRTPWTAEPTQRGLETCGREKMASWP